MCKNWSHDIFFSQFMMIDQLLFIVKNCFDFKQTITFKSQTLCFIPHLNVRTFFPNFVVLLSGHQYSYHFTVATGMSMSDVTRKNVIKLQFWKKSKEVAYKKSGVLALLVTQQVILMRILYQNWKEWQYRIYIYKKS